jgi:hypothetical protein
MFNPYFVPASLLRSSPAPRDARETVDQSGTRGSSVERSSQIAERRHPCLSINSLPAMLQRALLLLILCGVLSWYQLYHWIRTAAGVTLAFTPFKARSYLHFTLSATLSCNCPFRTPILIRTFDTCLADGNTTFTHGLRSLRMCAAYDLTTYNNSSTEETYNNNNILIHLENLWREETALLNTCQEITTLRGTPPTWDPSRGIVHHVSNINKPSSPVHGRSNGPLSFRAISGSIQRDN